MVDGKEVFAKAGPMVWAFVDPLIIGLPIAILITVLVTFVTKKFDSQHLDRCLAK